MTFPFINSFDSFSEVEVAPAAAVQRRVTSLGKSSSSKYAVRTNLKIDRRETRSNKAEGTVFLNK